MVHSKTLSVAAVSMLILFVLIYLFTGSVYAQDPTSSTFAQSDVDVLSGFVSVGSLFLLFGVLVLVVWTLAIVRSSVGMCAISSGLWVAFGFGLMVVGEPGNGFVVGFTFISFMLGVVMVVSMFYEIAMMVKGRGKNVDDGVF
jgi:hypothetical protein